MSQIIVTSWKCHIHIVLYFSTCLAVVDGDGALSPASFPSGAALAALPFRVHHDLVIDTKLALWHAR